MSAIDPAALQTFWTIAAFAAFVGIVIWAWSRRARRRFDEAERLPFADDARERAGDGNGDGR
jgi:cytochrome c oxidase cbb3-type subunit 4